MVYIKLENNMDKFMVKYQSLPKAIMKISFKSKCRNGRFKIEKVENMDYITLPEVNEKILKNLKHFADIRCWKNICVSDNLLENKEFANFANNNFLKIMDGKWLFKHMILDVIDYIVDIKKEVLAGQDISILCNNLDEVILEQIKEICAKVKICNVLTSNMKQYQRLEEEIYQTKGTILNVSNNYKRALTKSQIIVNFDFEERDLEKCIFSKNGYIINLGKKIKLDKKFFNRRNIVDFQINMPEKYIESQEKLNGFDTKKLYESFIYKNTNYKNIKKELLSDEVEITYLQDFNEKIIRNSNFNLLKTLDKIKI